MGSPQGRLSLGGVAVPHPTFLSRKAVSGKVPLQRLDPASR
jgi:hypothetical protein